MKMKMMITPILELSFIAILLLIVQYYFIYRSENKKIFSLKMIPFVPYIFLVFILFLQLFLLPLKLLKNEK